MSDEPSQPRAAYIHVPFCRHRCGYCDFTLVAGRDDLINAYLQALEMELHTLQQPREIDTLYFGGGTPTHLPVPQLRRLLELVHHWFPLAEGHEFTVEANPSDLNDFRVALLAEFGVNRLSLGVQSFDADVLRLLERDHRADDVRTAVERARRQIDNLSFDLIFGVPGQTLAVWEQTLRQAVRLGPQHVSTYGLTYERGTSFWVRRQRGQLVPLSDETERTMYARAMDVLSAAGFEQYEISNFARPGFRCRHNDVYWTGRPHYGFGPGAARYVGGCRDINHRSVTTWLKRVQLGLSPIMESERLSPEEAARELAVLGLRRCDGIDCTEFERQTGFEIHRLAADAIARHQTGGLLEEVEGHVRLTRAGRFLADSVIVDFV